MVDGQREEENAEPRKQSGPSIGRRSIGERGQGRRERWRNGVVEENEERKQVMIRLSAYLARRAKHARSRPVFGLDQSDKRSDKAGR